MIRRSVLLSVLFAMAGVAAAQSPVDLSVLDADLGGPRTRVLVLGSVHLSQLPEGVDATPEALQPLLDRLAAFRPDIITTEDLSGETCELMARHPTVYLPEDRRQYCEDTTQARASTGLDVPAAIAEMRRLLQDWPAEPAPAQRRRLAAVYLAAGESSSALVQWLQLPETERRAGDGLDQALVAQLRRIETRANESDRIAARLAARLGLSRVVPVDDHTGDNIDLGDDPQAYGEAIQGLWAAAAPRARPMRARQDALARSGDWVGLYRDLNQPASQQLAIESDFAAALRDRSPQRFGQRYVAGWEARNLRMVANVRAAIGDRPGARVLCVVGASHKPWFDSLLGQMQGVEIVDAVSVLSAGID